MIQGNPIDPAVPVLTVDGPSGSGKGTIAARVAQRLGWHLLDSGALYRLLALQAEAANVAFNDSHSLSLLAAQLEIEFVNLPSGEVEVLLAGKPVTEALRTEICAALASQIAVLPAVRDALLVTQRQFQIHPGLVADGRDMGTVVFPWARTKVFLTASKEERANRRYKQLKQKGISVSLSHLLAEIGVRDKRDTSRLIAPLKPAVGARIIDTTGLDIEEVVDQVLAAVHTN